MEERDDSWTTMTIRRGNVEVSILIDEDSMTPEIDTVHVVFYDSRERSQYAAYGQEDIYDFIKSMTEQEHKLWYEDAHQAMLQAHKFEWL